VNPPADAQLVPLALPLFINAGAVNGTVVAVSRAGDDMYYLVDNALADGPPVWVHEAEIEKCVVAPLQTRQA
jgi:hypothetical protein